MDNQNGQFSGQDQNQNNDSYSNENYYQDNLNNDQYQYQPNMNYQAEAPQTTSAAAVVSLVCGILSIILGCCCCGGMIPGIIGIICAIVSKKNEKSGVATAGLICSIIGTAFGLISLIFSITISSTIGSDPELVDNLRQFIQEQSL